IAESAGASSRQRQNIETGLRIWPRCRILSRDQFRAIRGDVEDCSRREWGGHRHGFTARDGELRNRPTGLGGNRKIQPRTIAEEWRKLALRIVGELGVI